MKAREGIDESGDSHRVQSETTGAATDDSIDMAFSSRRSFVDAGVCTEGQLHLSE
jgi:hypothetical protein